MNEYRLFCQQKNTYIGIFVRHANKKQIKIINVFLTNINKLLYHTYLSKISKNIFYKKYSKNI
jgi:hypothetical protein